MGNWGKRRGKRIGIMLHFDDSTSDASGIQWLTKDPRCKVSYNFAVRDDGSVVTIAPEEARAYHAGVCRPSSDKLRYTDANSAFYGIAITAKLGDAVPDAQRDAVVALCRRLYAKNGWQVTEAWRITGHKAEAWPRGRKIDPDPVLDPQTIREAL